MSEANWLESDNPEHPCRLGTCDHESHCWECGRGYSFPLDDDICMDCWIHWMARRQLPGSAFVAKYTSADGQIVPHYDDGTEAGL